MKRDLAGLQNLLLIFLLKILSRVHHTKTYTDGRPALVQNCGQLQPVLMHIFFFKIKMVFTSIFGTRETWQHLIMKKASSKHGKVLYFLSPFPFSYKWNQIEMQNKIHSTEIFAACTYMLSYSGKSPFLFILS